jgi:hypothetical protein
MIPQKAIKKFKNDAHREIVAGILLAYGFFPRTSEGIEEAKRFVAGLTEWIAPSDLPNYYNEIESDLMTGRETAGIMNIRMIMQEFYFGGGNKESEQEEIPVEVEIVEVEQKQPDEPVVVTIEAPFENPVSPGLPRRIRLPRRKNVIRVPRQKKKDTAERMADAFDARLDDLLDTIRNPDPGSAPPRVRKKKQVLATKVKKVSAKFENIDPYKAKTFTGFLGLKVKKAFGRAAEARRIAKEQGAEEQGRGYFLKKALGFEFGGDKLSRIKGTFSKSPTAVNDPALSPDQRFLAGIASDITPPPVKQGELFNTKQYETKTGLTKFFDDSVSRLQNSFARVDKKFADLIQIKRSVSDDRNQLLGIQKTIDGLKNALRKNNDTQSDINDTKTRQLELLFDIADAEQTAAAESGLEKGEDLSTTVKYQDPYGKLKSIAAGATGGGLLDGLLDFLDLKDLKNVKNLGRGALNVGKNIGRGALNLGRNAVSGVKGFVSGGAATAAAIVAGTGLAASGVGEGFFQLTKKGGIGEQVRDSLKQMGEKRSKQDPIGGMILGGLGNLAGVSTEATKTTGVALDAIGAPFRYAVEAIRNPFLNKEDKEKQANNLAKFDSRIREFSRGWMNQIDFLNVISDEKGGFGNIYGNAEAQSQMMEKMSEGGVVKFAEGGTVKAMIGEAGPEMLLRNGQDGGLNPYQSLAPMIIATREITKRVGNWADPIENYVKKITDPIAKQMRLSVVPLSTSLGKTEPPKIQQEDPNKKGGILEFLKNLFKGKDDKKSNSTGSGGTTDPGPGPASGDFWLLAVASLFENSNPQGAADVAQAIYNRLALPGWGKTIRDIILSPNQFQPVRQYGGVGQWSKITDRQTAVDFITKHGKTEDQLNKVVSALQDPAMQSNARQFVGARDNFRADSYERTANHLDDSTEVSRHGHTFGMEAGGANYGAFKAGKLSAGGVPTFDSSGTSDAQRAQLQTPQPPSPAKASMKSPIQPPSSNSLQPLALPAAPAPGGGIFVMPGAAPMPAAGTGSQAFSFLPQSNRQPELSLESIRQLSLGRR